MLNCNSKNPTGWPLDSRFGTVSQCECCGAKFAPPSPPYGWEDEDYHKAVKDWNLAVEEHDKHCGRRR